VGEHDMQSPEGRARAQFDAKPMLQAMTPTSLRLQIVRGLAQLTQTTPSEIEVLFELAKPVAVARKAPPRSGRPVPVGLELQIVRLLVAHPPLALEVDEAALVAFQYFGAEPAERLTHLVAQARELGPQGSFAAFAQQLKSQGDEYDAIIAEIGQEPESDFEAVRLFLRGAIRQVKNDALKQELSQLFAAGLTSEQIGVRYREITAQQDQLLREAQAETAKG